MIELQRGGNAGIDGAAVTVTAAWAGPAGLEADVSAYLVGADGKVRGDHDMVFYNQPSGGDGAVTLRPGSGSSAFTIDCARVPSAIARIVFCLTIEEAGARGHTFASLSKAEIAVAGGGAPVRFVPAREGAREAAMILGELYRREAGWKFRAVGQGFDGGLGPLARSFGIAVDDTPASPVSPPAPSPGAGAVSLEKKVAAKAPQLISLAKTAEATIAQKNLQAVKAQVVLVLDASGSMNMRYNNGTVQAVVDRILPLAVHFDDDGALDVWAYALEPGRLTSITLDNVAGYIAREGGGWRKWPLGPRGNNEPAVIAPLIEAYRGAALPTYIVFISDGGVGADKKIEKLLREASELPIFWQFVGIGGRGYGVFERLDTMTGRKVDNCNFFALDDLKDVTDAQLYDRLLGEFPSWLTEARKVGVIR